MNYLKIYFFILHVLLETSVLPDYLGKVISGQGLYFIVLLNGAFLTLSLLKKFRRSYVIAFAILDLYFFYQVLRFMYVKEMIISNMFYTFLLFGFFFLVFAYFLNNDDIKEFNSSDFFNNLFSLIGNVCFSHGLLGHFKTHHTATLGEYDSIDKVDFQKISLCFIADYIVFTNFLTFAFLSKAYYSKSKKRVYIFNIIKKVLLFIIYYGLFFANYNTALSDLIYRKFYDMVPKPHNVILYNCMPLNPDIRYRLIVVTLLNIFS